MTSCVNDKRKGLASAAVAEPALPDSATYFSKSLGKQRVCDTAPHPMEEKESFRLSSGPSKGFPISGGNYNVPISTAPWQQSLTADERWKAELSSAGGERIRSQVSTSVGGPRSAIRHRFKQKGKPAVYRKDGKDIGDLLNYKDYKVRQTSEDVRQIHDEFLKREKLQKEKEQNKRERIIANSYHPMSATAKRNAGLSALFSVPRDYCYQVYLKGEDTHEGAGLTGEGAIESADGPEPRLKF